VSSGITYGIIYIRYTFLLLLRLADTIYGTLVTTECRRYRSWSFGKVQLHCLHSECPRQAKKEPARASYNIDTRLWGDINYIQFKGMGLIAELCISPIGPKYLARLSVRLHLCRRANRLASGTL